MKRKEPSFVSIDAGTDWERRLLLSSVPLKRLSENMDVEGWASGCLIDYCGSRLILSVSHATLKSEGWVMEVGYDEAKGIAIAPLPAMHFLGCVATKDLLRFMQQDASIKDLDFVDFCYGVISNETNSIHHQLAEDGRLLWLAPRTVFKPTLKETPNEIEDYGFSGHTQLEYYPHPTDPQRRILCGNQIVCSELKYVRTEGDMHYFQLGGKHPGHQHFRGCSGAPIIDRHGELVALVAGGDETNDTIRGVSLPRYKTAIDLQVGNVPGTLTGQP